MHVVHMRALAYALAPPCVANVRLEEAERSVWPGASGAYTRKLVQWRRRAMWKLENLMRRTRPSSAIM
jgi:hypothetical protein